MGGKIFSLLPQNQKESDQSHLDNLKYIIYGHFEEWHILADSRFRWDPHPVIHRPISPTNRET